MSTNESTTRHVLTHVHRSPVYMTQQTSRKSIGGFLSLMVPRRRKIHFLFYTKYHNLRAKTLDLRRADSSLNPLDMYTLKYFKWPTNKGLLCSTWNPAQSMWQPGWKGSSGENEHMYGLPLWCRR